MAIKPPTQKQISSLVGGKPLAHNFDPETGSLVVIGPTGQKFRFSQQDWMKSESSEADVAEESPPNGNTGLKEEENHLILIGCSCFTGRHSERFLSPQVTRGVISFNQRI